eukprot:1918352-Prymnesium_polylepis.1
MGARAAHALEVDILTLEREAARARGAVILLHFASGGVAQRATAPAHNPTRAGRARCSCELRNLSSSGNAWCSVSCGH